MQSASASRPLHAASTLPPTSTRSARPVAHAIRRGVATTLVCPAPLVTARGLSAPTAPAEPPQAGIVSKAGNSTEKEDFSTLFGTIGLPNLTI